MLSKKSVCGIILYVGLSGCGTTFELPELGDVQTSQASKMFADAQSEGDRPRLSAGAAERRFFSAKNRIQPVGEKYCEAATKSRDGFNCSVKIEIDRRLKERNAYFTYEGQQPVIRISIPMLQDTKSDDEVGFILGHEYGHLIGRHIEKQQQQALAGALILGAITAAATAQSTPYGTYYDTDAVNSAVDLGAAAGTMAYSQSYELESDTLGTRIAYAAGFDPVKGAKFFARPEDSRTSQGKLSFWGTHPPDEKRVATVIATVEQIEANVSLQRVK